MRYREIQPGAEASTFIDCYWVLETDAADPAEVQRVVPDGRPELIVNLGRPFESCANGVWHAQPSCFLSGQLTGPLLLRPVGPARILGVRFHPFGAAQAFGLPMHELTGQILPMDQLASFDSMARLEAALVRRARESGDRVIPEAVRQIVAAGGGRDIARLAAWLGVSTRQLERRFQDQVGMPPKLFSRIQRFQRIFQEIGDGRPNWVDAAIACGYHDQAHLIRDFRDFTGKTPASLLAEADLARHFLSHFYKTA